MQQAIHAVTGAFGYSGKYIAKRLLERGERVITLTNSLDRENAFQGQVPAKPFNFDDPAVLATSLEGVSVLYNTYWVRFNHKLFKQCDAVANTIKLFEAAKTAGVGRIVHFSITNPSLDSPLEYFRSKAVLEEALKDTGVSHAILRPTVLFGKEDILINNIAWALRHLPVFGIFGDGNYRLQPIHVDDMAALAVEQGASRNNAIIDAIGPEAYTYRELAKAVGKAIGKQRPVISVPPAVGYWTGWLLGKMVGDVMITRAEIDGLMADLLHVDSAAAGPTRLSEWMAEHADTLGCQYTSELARRKDTTHAYSSN